MSYILMAQQETGEECRATDKLYDTWAEADGQIDNIMDEHEEWHSCWVEELKDQAYYYRMLNRQTFTEGYYNED